MANQHRGAIDAELDGRRWTLCLTLGALAELEARLQAADLVGLAQRFETGRLAARDLIALLGCGLRGGGHTITDDEVGRLTVPEGLTGYVQIAARLLAATFGSNEDTNPVPSEPQNA